MISFRKYLQPLQLLYHADIKGYCLNVANKPWGAGEGFAHLHTLLVNEKGVCLHRNVMFQL